MQIVASAPVRTADLGGWTDTWFASSGCVCNVAVEPGIGIDLEFEADRRLRAKGPTVTVAVGAGVYDYVVTPGVIPIGVDPLIAAVIAAVPPPWDTSIRISSGVPAGSGLGTSAALAVALLAGLHALHGRSHLPLLWRPMRTGPKPRWDCNRAFRINWHRRSVGHTCLKSPILGSASDRNA